MTIFINARVFSHPAGGVRRYATEVTACLNDDVVLFQPRDAARGWQGHIWEQFSLPRMLPADGLLWSPANTGPLGLNRQIISIHDVGVLDHPEWYSRSFAAWYRFAIPQIARKCRKIITLSRFSKSRIIERLQVPDGKVAVIAPGVGEPFKPQPLSSGWRRKLNDGRDYLLALGPIQPRKNLNVLFEAWPAIRGQWSNLDLIIIGTRDGVFGPSKYDIPQDGVCFLDSVNDDELAKLYCGAEALVYPSLYEGFGMPILEAMACGTPVIASNAPAHLEASGKAALHFKAAAADELIGAVQHLRGSESLRKKLARKGLARSRSFTWQRTARQVQDIFQEIESS